LDKNVSATLNVFVQIKIGDTNNLIRKQYTTMSPFQEHNTHELTHVTKSFERPSDPHLNPTRASTAFFSMLEDGPLQKSSLYFKILPECYRQMILCKKLLLNKFKKF